MKRSKVGAERKKRGGKEGSSQQQDSQHYELQLENIDSKKEKKKKRRRVSDQSDPSTDSQLARGHRPCGNLALLATVLRPAVGHVTLDQPVAGLHELHHVDDLLERHDGCRDSSDDPRPEAVNLVGPCQLQRPGAPGAVVQIGWGCLGGAIGERLKEGRRERRRGEREEIEADEESFVKGAADEQNGLVDRWSVTRQNRFVAGRTRRCYLPCYCSTSTRSSCG